MKIEHGYHVEAGFETAGWYAAVLQLIDRDNEFTFMSEDAMDRELTLLPGKTFEDWVAASLDSPSRIILLKEKTSEQALLAAGIQVHPPVVPRERVSSPTVAWCEREGENWALKLHTKAETRTVQTGRDLFARLSVCVALNKTYLAWQSWTSEGEARVVVKDECGSPICEVKGMNPVLRAAGRFLVLSSEEVSDGRISLQVTKVDPNSGRGDHCVLGAENEFKTHADLLVHGDRVDVLCEVSPAWGGTPYLGSHRSIERFELSLAVGIERIAHEVLPIPRQRFSTKEMGERTRNCVPIYPRWIDGHDADLQPGVAYRRITPMDPFRPSGWDVFLIRQKGDSWTPPQKISKTFGLADTGYTILRRKEGCVGFLSSCRYEGDSTPTKDICIEIECFDPGMDLGDIDVPASFHQPYLIPQAVELPCPAPPDLVEGPDGYELLWGDLHRHSLLSKCMCSRDGSPEECYRYCRDVLGCDVLTLTDHHHHMSFGESLWGSIQLEEEAVGRLSIYGSEPGNSTGEDTNFYAWTREVWDSLRFLLVHHYYRQEIYDAIRRLMPEDSVDAARHIHGAGPGPCGNTFTPEELVETYAPDLEPAMETLQVRGCYLLDGEFEKHPTSPRHFPENYLNAGVRIGILGGTDHTSGRTVNYFGLTGLWVRERTLDAVREAMRSGRTVASANGKIAVWAASDGKPLGSEIQAVDGKVRIDVSVSSARELKRIGLMRDGEMVHWQDLSGTSWKGVIEDLPVADSKHWYMLIIQAESAYTERVSYDLDDPMAPWGRAFSGAFYFGNNKK